MSDFDRLVTEAVDKNWALLGLKLADCDRLEIVAALKDSEVATAMPWSWPSDLRDKMRAEIERWALEHTGRRILAITYGLSDTEVPNCVVVVHHAPAPAAACTARGAA